jgi:hypothetical protein
MLSSLTPQNGKGFQEGASKGKLESPNRSRIVCTIISSIPLLHQNQAAEKKIAVVSIGVGKCKET